MLSGFQLELYLSSAFVLCIRSFTGGCTRLKYKEAYIFKRGSLVKKKKGIFIFFREDRDMLISKKYLFSNIVSRILSKDQYPYSRGTWNFS